MAAILPRTRYQPKFPNKICAKYIDLPRNCGRFAPIRDTDIKSEGVIE